MNIIFTEDAEAKKILDKILDFSTIGFGCVFSYFFRFRWGDFRTENVGHFLKGGETQTKVAIYLRV